MFERGDTAMHNQRAVRVIDSGLYHGESSVQIQYLTTGEKRVVPYKELYSPSEPDREKLGYHYPLTPGRVPQ